MLNNTKYHNYKTKCKKLKLKHLKRYMTENRVVINLVLASSFLFLSEQSSNILSLEKLISMNPSGVINKNFMF